MRIYKYIIRIYQLITKLYNFIWIIPSSQIENQSMNPESFSPSMISPKQMYSYDRGTNKSWNMSEYKTPRIYQDAKLEQNKRKWATQKKGVPDSTKYVTKRGFYMDYHIKVSKSVPGSSIYRFILRCT